MNKCVKLTNFIIFILLLFYLLVDILTGVSMRLTDYSFSVPYKIFVLFLMLFVISCYSIKDVTKIVGLIALLFLALCFLFFVGIAHTSFYLQTYIKSMANLLMYLYFMNCIRYEKHIFNYVKWILRINLFVFIANLLLGALGFGYATYENNGTKGFFYAGNEIYLIHLSICLFLIKSNKNKWMVCFYLFVCSVIIGTKSVILGSLILLFYSLYSSIKHKLIFLLSILIIVAVFYYSIIQILSTLPLVVYIFHNFHNIMDMSGSILNAIMSGRVVFIQQAFVKWISVLNLPIFFFGSGDAIIQTVESDLFDSLFIHGMVFTLILFFFYLYLCIRAGKMNDSLLVILDVLFIFISILAGHTWQNVSGGLFFILANCFADCEIFFRSATNKRC